TVQLMADLVRAKGDGDEADAMLKDVPPLPPLPALPGVPALPFKPAWVGVVSTELRGAPNESGQVLEGLRANHPVVVLGVEKSYARVRTNLGHLVAVDPFGNGKVEFPGGSQVQGYVTVSALTSESLDEDELLERAQHASEAGKNADSLVLFGRAAALQPRES